VFWAEECAAVIPCFNEAKSIEQVVSAVLDHVPNMLVVDDGSTDSTSQAAEQAGAQVIRFSENRGKGAALSEGLDAASRRGFTWAMVLDGDGQHAPADIPRFFDAAETGARLVIGNRMNNPGPMPLVRRFVNRWMSKRLSRQAGRHLPDTQCGFRLVHLQSWGKLGLRTRHFEIESEMLLAFLEAGWRVEFVPIQVIYKRGNSKIHPILDTLRWFRWWFSWRKAAEDCRTPKPAEVRGN